MVVSDEYERADPLLHVAMLENPRHRCPMRPLLLALALAIFPLACDSYSPSAPPALRSDSSLRAASAARVGAHEKTSPSAAVMPNEVWLDLVPGAQNNFPFHLAPLREGDQIRSALQTPDGREAVALLQQRTAGQLSFSVSSPEAVAMRIEARMGDRTVASLVGSFAGKASTSIGISFDTVTSIHEGCSTRRGRETCYFYYDLTGTPTGSGQVFLFGTPAPVQATTVGVVIERDVDKQTLAPSHILITMTDGMVLTLLP